MKKLKNSEIFYKFEKFQIICEQLRKAESILNKTNNCKSLKWLTILKKI